MGIIIAALLPVHAVAAPTFDSCADDKPAAIVTPEATIPASEPAAQVVPEQTDTAIEKPISKSELKADSKRGVVGEFADADAILAALEKTGSDIRTLSADLTFARKFAAIEGAEKQERLGTVHFKQDVSSDDPSRVEARMFRVEYEVLIVDGKKQSERQTFMFDGEWLIERQYHSKLQIKRQVVEPGKKIDPLAIGQGPFPIPIGQKKDKILERFIAVLNDSADGFPLEEGFPAPAWLKETVQLMLTPKPGTDEARDMASVRIWYYKDSAGRWLPRLLLRDDKNKAFTQIMLRNIVVNTELPKDIFNSSKPGADWSEEVHHFERPNADK